jgi:hypothetical protein
MGHGRCSILIGDQCRTQKVDVPSLAEKLAEKKWIRGGHTTQAKMRIKNFKKVVSDVVECTSKKAVVGKGIGKKAKAPPRGVKVARLTGNDDQAVWGNQEPRRQYYDAGNHEYYEEEGKDDGPAEEERNQDWAEMASFREENLWLLRQEAKHRHDAKLPPLPVAVYEAQGVGHKRYDAATLIQRAVKEALTNPERTVCQNRLLRELGELVALD